MQKLTAWKVPIPAAESDGVPALVAGDRAHARHPGRVHPRDRGPRPTPRPRRCSTRSSAPTPEGVELADILLNLGSPSRRRHPQQAHPRRVHPLHARRPDRRLAEDPQGTGLGPAPADVAGGRSSPSAKACCPLPLAPEAYWLFDEFLRKATLLFLSEARPISIEIPDTNRPS